MYFRITTPENTFIATYNENVAENKTFLYFTEVFKNIASPVPSIHAVSPDMKLYIQEDLGSRSLLDELEQQGDESDNNPAIEHLRIRTIRLHFDLCFLHFIDLVIDRLELLVVGGPEVLAARLGGNFH